MKKEDAIIYQQKEVRIASIILEPLAVGFTCIMKVELLDPSVRKALRIKTEASASGGIDIFLTAPIACTLKPI